jgi:hypothetical protein
MKTNRLNIFCFYQYYTLCAIRHTFSSKNDHVIYYAFPVYYLFFILKKYKETEINSVKTREMDFAA